MSYNTIAEFKSNALPIGAYEKLPDDIIKYQLDAAYSLINVNLGIGNDTPLLSNDPSIIGLIKRIELILASYNLLAYRGMKDSSDGSYQMLSDLYAEAMNPEFGLLTQLRKRVLLLDKEAAKNVRKMNLKSWGTPNPQPYRRTSDGRRIIKI